MPRTMLLFDIDGTLVDTAGAGPRAMHNTAQRLFDGRLSFEGIEMAGRLDPSLFAEAAERCGFTPEPGAHERMREAYVAELVEEMRRSADHVRALPGTLELLAQLSEIVQSANGDGPVLGCLTGNYGPAAHAKFHATGFDPEVFTITAFGDEAPTRPGLAELAMKRYETAHGHAADPKRVVVIGDTPHDIACAQAHGCVALAVATGQFDEAQLRSAGADIVVGDLTDASVVLDLI